MECGERVYGGLVCERVYGERECGDMECGEWVCCVWVCERDAVDDQ